MGSTKTTQEITRLVKDTAPVFKVTGSKSKVKGRKGANGHTVMVMMMAYIQMSALSFQSVFRR